MDVYRLVPPHKRHQPLDADGASQYGGRWNSIGRPVIYTASSCALAMLEVLVHLNRVPPRNPAIFYKLTIPDTHIDSPLDPPEGWRQWPAPFDCVDAGDTWLGSIAALALPVPSVVLPFEYNYLLNPAHPAFKDIQTEGPFEADWDGRFSPS